jgi:hypothetical protein
MMTAISFPDRWRHVREARRSPAHAVRGFEDPAAIADSRRKSLAVGGY